MSEVAPVISAAFLRKAVTTPKPTSEVLVDSLVHVEQPVDKEQPEQKPVRRKRTKQVVD